ncbi:MAG: hypothetical protein M3438_08775, partial [Pseudomonadota bacterium]|nr:hypothetical protein [Pseudomonadota bacterium]
AAPGETPGIVLIDVVSKAVRPVARSDSSAGDVKPVFSPDGRRLAFLRRDQLERQQIAVVDLQPGSAAKILPAPAQQLRGLDWAPDGESLVFSAKSGRRFGLWRLQADGSKSPEVYPVEGGDVFNPSISRDGRIAVEEVEQDSDVWSADLVRNTAAPLILSTSRDYEPAYAPGGNRLAFVSERSGSPEIWIQSWRGEAQRRTSLSTSEIRNISWSPDGARLAFVAEKDGASTLYTAPASGADPVRLLRNAEGLIPIGWGGGGHAVFLLTADTGIWRLEELNLAERKRRPIPAPGLRLAAVAADGRSIFAVPARGNMLLQIVPGRGSIRQFRLASTAGLVALLPAPDALYLVEETPGSALVHRLDMKSGAIRLAGRINDYYGGALSLGMNGRSVAYTRDRETANDLAWTQLSTRP